MNPILLILALLFLIPITKEIRLLIRVKWYSKRIIGQVTNDIIIKETFTRYYVSILQGGKYRSIKISYKFRFNNKEYKIVNDDLVFSPKSKFNKLKKDDNIDIYVYSKNNEIKNTWLFKPTIMRVIPLMLLFIMLLIVAYLSADMYWDN
ncbi:hypothetical protein [Tamlana sp. I1]|uniref:hypothetical protein n=1 Tax=Tamlana sp. I1 TaxID=2762061 RepID=UPI00188DDCDE|nr:hypothetical protein [Tamlana sp. I1]